MTNFSLILFSEEDSLQKSGCQRKALILFWTLRSEEVNICKAVMDLIIN